MPTRPHPSQETQRQRESRRRRRERVRLVRLEVGPAILKALIKRRWLSKADTDDLGTIRQQRKRQP